MKSIVEPIPNKYVNWLNVGDGQPIVSIDTLAEAKEAIETANVARDYLDVSGLQRLSDLISAVDDTEAILEDLSDRF